MARGAWACGEDSQEKGLMAWTERPKRLPYSASSSAVEVHVISDLETAVDIRDRWDAFVEIESDSPFMLSGFIKHFMRRARSHGWIPILLIFSAHDTIIGTVPLVTRRKWGIRYAKSPSIYQSIAASDPYKEMCVSKTLDFLFQKLRCQFVGLVLPAASSFKGILKRECHEKGIILSQTEDRGQSILAVDCAWNEFAKSRGKKFLQDIRRTERNLSQAGRWRCFHIETPDRSREALEHMMRIEMASWKQSYRNIRGQQVDETLSLLWAGLQCASRTVSSLKWRVWFLELNDRMVAYALLIRFKDVAFAVKTSYDREFARFGPGTYIMNAAIRSVFEEGASKVDFISDIPLTRTWTLLHLRRMNFTMTVDKGLSKVMVILFRQGVFGRNVSRPLFYLRTRLKWASDAIPFLDVFTDPF